MSKYTTGELAKLCNVSVRTVQFYDTKDLLNPSELTEGGRRLYTDNDLKQLQLICLLKSLGLSLNSIKQILHSKNSNKVLSLLLEEQARNINKEIKTKQKILKSIETIKEHLNSATTIPVNSITDINHIMEGNKKLKKTKRTMLIVGILMDCIEIATIIIWIVLGIWWPFVVGMSFVIITGCMLIRMYYKNSAYICSECEAKFKPNLKEFLFSYHTTKARKLTCTKCNKKSWCIETFSNTRNNK